MLSDFLKNDKFRAYAQILIGCVIGATAYPLFLIPNNIAPGGLTGVATIINYFIKVPVGTLSLILNVPLFILGYKSAGKIFVFRSLIATVLFSFFIDILPFSAVTKDPLLASLYGGIFLGFGLGLILRGGATTGGTDLIARIIHKRMPFITVGAILFVADFLVVVAAGVGMGAELAMYAIICILVTSAILDVTMQGLNRAKACYIISNKNELIRQRLMEETERGITIIHATGAYTMEEKPVILCIVNPRETVDVKRIVKEVDSKAFMFITEAHEVLGEGFEELK
ncbi:MAG: YitT family protein [Christensenellaceae bacterium]|nr:YitT family protein [Christensenellaceae bacterium]